jgi:hypothetical protein
MLSSKPEDACRMLKVALQGITLSYHWNRYEPRDQNAFIDIPFNVQEIGGLLSWY